MSGWSVAACFGNAKAKNVHTGDEADLQKWRDAKLEYKQDLEFTRGTQGSRRAGVVGEAWVPEEGTRLLSPLLP